MTRMIYQGRKWDAPFTDDAIEHKISGQCMLCSEPIEPDDDATATAYLTAHLECQIRSMTGDVQHLEGRCTCAGVELSLPSDEYATYRESAKATLDWLITHKQGRFHP